MINLSIIIPHYNTHELLEKLLNTIPKENDLEVIVIDDNSDKSLSLLSKIISNVNLNNFVYLKNNTEVKGAGVCRNIGLKKARGTWVTFVDSDDYLKSNFYSAVSHYFTEKNDVVFFPPSSQLIETNQLSNRHENYVKILDAYSENKDAKNELILRYQYGIPVSKMYNKKFLITKDIYFEEIIAGNDVLFSTKVGHFMSKFEISKKSFYIIIKRKGSLTQNISKEVFRARLQSFISRTKFLKLNLSKNNYKILKSNGYGYYLSAIQNRYGIKELSYVYKTLRKNNIKLIDINIIHPKNLTTFIRLIIQRRNDRSFKE